ncbi:MAG: hypothetical protein ABIC04_04345 [Nanoarchaeota archaeon]
MIIKSKLKRNGFSINLWKDAMVEYPVNVWKALDTKSKKTIIANLLYLKISPYTMLWDKEFRFDSSQPYLKKMGDRAIMRDIPRIAEMDKRLPRVFTRNFNNKKIKFLSNDAEKLKCKSSSESALIGMSFGKDSLLSYGIAKEIRLKPKLVMVQDFWDVEADHKFNLIHRFEKEFKTKVFCMSDYLDNISSIKRFNRTNSIGIICANAMNAYLTMLLPIAMYFKTRYLVFGNEQNFNDYYPKNGLKVYPSYDQSSEWMKEQNSLLSKFTQNKFQISSFVEPIYNIAEIKVLFNRYPKIAKYQMSCSSVKTIKERWCYSCPMCAKAFLFLKSNGVDPKIVKFKHNFFNRKYEKLYPLFKAPSRIYEKPKAVRDEQLFAFYLATKNKSEGYLIDKFKKRFMSEAVEREDELYKKFFRIYKAPSLPKRYKKEIRSILAEELR